MTVSAGYLFILLSLGVVPIDSYRTGPTTKAHGIVALERLSRQEAAAHCTVLGLQLGNPTYEDVQEVRRRVFIEKGDLPVPNMVSFHAAGRVVGNRCPVVVPGNGRLRRRGYCITPRFFVCVPQNSDNISIRQSIPEINQKQPPQSQDDPGIEKISPWAPTELGTTTLKTALTTTTAKAVSTNSGRRTENDGYLGTLAILVLCLTPWNLICVMFCMWTVSLLEWRKATRHVIHMNQFALLFVGQLLLIFSACKLCHIALGVPIHFVYVSALLLVTVEALHYIHAAYIEDTPSESTYYLALAYGIALVLAALGTKFYPPCKGYPYPYGKQLCSPSDDKGTSIYMLAPAAISLVVSAMIGVPLLWYYHCRVDTDGPVNARTNIPQMGLMSLLLGLQWISGSFIASDRNGGIDVHGILFFVTGILFLPTAVMVSHIFCDRERRSVLARRLGQGGKTSRRIADLIRPAPQNVSRSEGGGFEARVTYHNSQSSLRHARPHVSDRLRSTLERGIRPSIHLISPLELAPVQQRQR